MWWANSDESTLVSKTFLEEHGNTVWVLDMGGSERKDYLFFFNEPNGTFLYKADDLGEYHLCSSFTSGSISINGEVLSEITQNDNQCLTFLKDTGETGTIEICEATYSTEPWIDGKRYLCGGINNEHIMVLGYLFRFVIKLIDFISSKTSLICLL